jgi:hypothetical protein
MLIPRFDPHITLVARDLTKFERMQASFVNRQEILRVFIQTLLTTLALRAPHSPPGSRAGNADPT